MLDKIKNLVDELNEHTYKYYVLNAPVISDYEFDLKLKELESLEKETGIFLPNSPTVRIGSDLRPDFNEVSRTRIMGSIANCYDYGELRKWCDSIISSNLAVEFEIEPKYDGLSCSLIYKNGILVEASTRGNGYVGSDITENAKTIKSIPLQINIRKDSYLYNDYRYTNIFIPEVLEVRGEILLPKSELKRINEERKLQNLPLFANERNAAAGSIKQLDSSITASRNLIFKPYAVYCDDSKFSKYLIKQSMMIDIAELFGFLPGFYLTALSTDTVIKLVQQFEVRYLHNQDFCMDGCVIKVNSFGKQQQLGYTQKVPKWAKAFKFKQEQISTKLLSVEWEMGRTGKLTPVGILNPVEVDGSVISKVSLNNIDYINELNLQTGSYVFIEKGGGVIPKVTGVDYERNIQENIVLDEK